MAGDLLSLRDLKRSTIRSYSEAVRAFCHFATDPLMFFPGRGGGDGHVAGESADHVPAEAAGAAVQVWGPFARGCGVEVADGDVHRCSGGAELEGVVAAAVAQCVGGEFGHTRASISAVSASKAGSRLSAKARATSRARGTPACRSSSRTTGDAGAGVPVVFVSFMR
jgi:hypothetical protein